MAVKILIHLKVSLLFTKCLIQLWLIKRFFYYKFGHSIAIISAFCFNFCFQSQNSAKSYFLCFIFPPISMHLPERKSDCNPCALRNQTFYISFSNQFFSPIIAKSVYCRYFSNVSPNVHAPFVSLLELLSVLQ